MTLTKEQTKEAIEKKWCPFCKDECKSFYGSVLAWQEFWFDDDEEEELVWDELKGDDAIQDVFCKACDAEIPSEIWKEWLKDKQ